MEIDDLTEATKSGRQDQRGYTLEQMSRDLFHTSSKEQVFRVLFKYLAASFDQMAVFVLRQNEIWGWTQHGFSIDSKKFRRKLADLQQTSAISEVFRQRDIILSAILSDTDRQLLVELGGRTNVAYHLFPISMGKNLVGCLLATRGEHPRHEITAELTGTIQESLAKVGIALHMVHLRRKLLVHYNE
jgi:K+-sensing histidine kinase KdpD